MPAPEPRALVLAHLEVVRTAARLLSDHGVPPIAAVDAASALVERWAEEGGVDDRELAAAAEAAWADGAAFRTSGDPRLRARMWLGTAAGNVAFLARRARGWKDAPRTILDAAAAALSSLRVDGLPGRAELEALAARALADAPPAPARKRIAAAPKLGKVGPTPELGALASAALARRKPVRDPRRTADRAVLTALLVERGLPISEAALAFEARFGGVRFAEVEGEEGDRDVVLGPWALLEGDAATPGRDRGLVPIALTAGDLWYLLDADGAAWVHDTIEQPEPVPFASSAPVALARIALYLRAFQDRASLGAVDLDGRCGAEVAGRLGLAFAAEASDERARFWGDARTRVVEHHLDGAPVTTVIGRAAKKLLPPGGGRAGAG